MRREKNECFFAQPTILPDIRQRGHRDCGIAALAAATRSTYAAAMRAAFPRGKETKGYPMLSGKEIARAARKLGYPKAKVVRKLTHFSRPNFYNQKFRVPNRPFVVSIEWEPGYPDTGHYVVWNPAYRSFHDPAGKMYSDEGYADLHRLSRKKSPRWADVVDMGEFRRQIPE